MKQVFEDFHNLITRNKAVAIVKQDGKDPNLVITPKDTTEEFTETLHGALVEDGDCEILINTAESFDYGYKVEINVTARMEDKTEEGRTYEIIFGSKY